MDYFRLAGCNIIGHGGFKCSCCNPFRSFGSHGGKRRGLNRLRRSRVKCEDQKNFKKELDFVEKDVD